MIGEIELAILARIDAVSKLGGLGYTLRQVESLPADLIEELPTYVAQFPAAWTYLGDMRSVGEVGRSTKVEWAINVLVGARNLRSERASRFGGAATEVGSYQIANDIAQLLLGQTLSLPMDPLRLDAISPIYSGARIDKSSASIMGVRFVATFLVEPVYADLGDQPLGNFAEFHAAWLPAVGLTHDHVTIPTEESPS